MNRPSSSTTIHSRSWANPWGVTKASWSGIPRQDFTGYTTNPVKRTVCDMP
jgi:hypothetical protein